MSSSGLSFDAHGVPRLNDEGGDFGKLTKQEKSAMGPCIVTVLALTVIAGVLIGLAVTGHLGTLHSTGPTHLPASQSMTTLFHQSAWTSF